MKVRQRDHFYLFTTVDKTSTYWLHLSAFVTAAEPVSGATYNGVKQKHAFSWTITTVSF